MHTNRCLICKDKNSKLLMLKCHHDICIKCACENYFINCKNKIRSSNKNGSNRVRQNNYFCQKCLEQTEMEDKTLDILKNYFRKNYGDRDKDQRRKNKDEGMERQRVRKDQRKYVSGSQTPKVHSLDIQIAQRKRTLSKYLNTKQVDKFIQMQEQYNPVTKKPLESIVTLGGGDKGTPQSHHHKKINSGQTNQYELTQGIERSSKKDLQQYNKNNRFSQNIGNPFGIKDEYERRRVRENNGKIRRKKEKGSQHKRMKTQENQFDLYHNGRGVPNYSSKPADYFLEKQSGAEDRQSGYSSSSSSKAVGKIMVRRSPKPHDNQLSPIPASLQYEKRQRLSSCKSEQNLIKPQRTSGNQTQVPSLQQNQKRNSQSSAEWEVDGRSTKRYEQKTIIHKNHMSADNLDKILDTLELSNFKMGKEREYKDAVIEPKSQARQLYFCKIHQNEEIIYFCLKCNKLICSQCGLRGIHKEHEIYSLRRSGQMLRQQLLHYMNILGKMMVEQQGKQKILTECVSQINLQCDNQKYKIKESFQSFIFSVEKKYKQLLKQIEEKYSFVTNEYVEKLNQSRNNYVLISKIKDHVGDTLEQCKVEEKQGQKISATNQLGNFHVKMQKQSQGKSYDFQTINTLMGRIEQVSQFLKNSNALLFSNKKESLLSQRSSLKLSDSSNLLEQDMICTPATNTPPQSTPLLGSSNTTPKRTTGKRMKISSYCLNLSSSVKILRCENAISGLIEMEDIVKALKLEGFQYRLKAMM